MTDADIEAYFKGAMACGGTVELGKALCSVLRMHKDDKLKRRTISEAFIALLAYKSRDIPTKGEEELTLAAECSDRS